MNLDELFSAELKKPKQADYIKCEYEGITFYIYGILHGITGGTNQEYVEFINNTIKHSQGLKLAEKSMLKMYKGLDGELDDWVQMTPKDTFILTLRLCTSPFAIGTIIKTTIKEKLQRKDRFNLNYRRLQDIGGSPYFHLLEPSQRRLYMGFPNPKDYFVENYNRRMNKSNLSPIVFPDRDWNWLTYIEKNVNIPYRSIHMIESAVVEAKKRNVKEVSLFIGEVHNTDIAWYVNKGQLDSRLESEIDKIKKDAREMNRSLKKIEYLSAAGLAAFIPIITVFSLLLHFKLI
jgi:hypothetical protein